MFCQSPDNLKQRFSNQQRNKNCFQALKIKKLGDPLHKTELPDGKTPGSHQRVGCVGYPRHMGRELIFFFEGDKPGPRKNIPCRLQ